MNLRFRLWQYSFIIVFLVGCSTTQPTKGKCIEPTHKKQTDKRQPARPRGGIRWMKTV